MRKEIFELIANKIAELTGREPSEITEETSLKTEICLKSIEVVAIISELESDYDAYIKYTDLMHAKTIGEMTDYVMEQIEG